jgi:hypothetical protein
VNKKRLRTTDLDKEKKNKWNTSAGTEKRAECADKKEREEPIKIFKCTFFILCHILGAKM